MNQKQRFQGKTVEAELTRTGVESGFHSYSTFSTAFKQRMHKSVTAWIREEVFSPSPRTASPNGTD